MFIHMQNFRKRRFFPAITFPLVAAGTLLSCGEETTEPLGDFVVAEYAELPVCDDMRTGAKARVEAFDLSFFCNGERWVGDDSVAAECRLAGYLVDLRDEPPAKCDSNGILRDPRDGREYRCAKVGNAVWMLDNLKFGTFAENGGDYGNPTNWCEVRKDCSDSTCGGGAWYNLATALAIDTSLKKVYINDLTVEPHRGICPMGWHIPTYGELVDAAVGLSSWNKTLIDRGEYSRARIGIWVLTDAWTLLHSDPPRGLWIEYWGERCNNCLISNDGDGGISCSAGRSKIPVWLRCVQD